MLTGPPPKFHGTRDILERPSLPSLSQQDGGAGGSPIRMVAGGCQAAPTKSERVSTARWCGSGERASNEYARNQRLRLSRLERLEPGG